MSAPHDVVRARELIQLGMWSVRFPHFWEYTLTWNLCVGSVLDAARAVPVKVKQRGVDFPCEDCGALAGNFVRDGWYRCKACGYPSK